MKSLRYFVLIFFVHVSLQNFVFSQNVGIGLTTPTDKLTILSADSNLVRLLGPGIYQSKARLTFGDANRVFIEEDIDDALTISGFDRMALKATNIILDATKVGIGTPTPDWDLDIVGGGLDDGAVLQMSNSDKSQFVRMFSGRLNDPNPFLSWKIGSPFKFITANDDFSNVAERMRIDVDGNVGIGTIAPEAKLHIEDAAPGLMLKDNDNLSTAAGSSGIINAYGSDGVGGTSTGRLWYLGSNSFSTSDAIFGNQTPTGKLLFATNGAARMTVDAAGKVGIGILAPNNNLEVNDQSRFSVDVTNPDYVRFGNVDNSLDVASLEGAGAVQVVLDANNNDADTKAFYIRKNTSDGPILMTVGESGNVGIGTTTLTNSDMASGYKLSVNGKIASIEVRVQPTADWPDYVFDHEYPLMPLDELEKSIESNHHLPGIPSAQEVKDGGIMLGEMQTLSIEKIEELTLYLLQMNKEMKELKQQVNHLQKENAAQANEINKLKKD
jgi:hypothetical protein